MAETAWSADAVQIRLSSLGEVEVDNNIHTLNVDASGEQIGTHEVSCSACTELMEHTISICLTHLCMDIETWIAAATVKDTKREEGKLGLEVDILMRNW